MNIDEKFEEDFNSKPYFVDFNYKKYRQVLSSSLVSFSKSQRALKQLYLVFLKEKFFLKLMKYDFFNF